MTRTKPPAAVLALIAEIDKHGFTATATQVERWQGQVWLPPSRDWLVAGSAMLRPEIVHRAVWLAAVSRPGRSIGWLGWAFWAIDDTPQSAQRLRQELLAALKRPLVRAGVDQVTVGNSDKASRARQEAAARLLEGRRSHRHDFDGIVRAHGEAAGFELPRSLSCSMPNLFHRAVLETGARLLLGGASDVAFEDLVEAWEQACPDGTETIERVRAAHREAALNAGDDVDYVDLMEQSPLADGLAGLLHAVEEADDRTLCAAVRLCTKASGALRKLLDERAPHEPEILPRLMSDVMWDQWVRIGGIVPDGVAGEAVIAMSTIQYLVIPGWAADLERYLAVLESLLLAPLPKSPNP